VSQSGSLDQPPLILRQRPRSFKASIILGGVSAGMAQSGAFAHKLIDGIIPAQTFCLVAGWGFLILGLALSVLWFLAPPKLIFGPDGLTWTTPLTRKTAPWSSLTGVRPWQHRGKTMGLQISCSPNFVFHTSGKFHLTDQQVITLITRAKRYWAG
jgi:hypothetical protein